MKLVPLLPIFLLAPLLVQAHEFTTSEARVTFEDGSFVIDMQCDLDALALGVPQSSDDAELAARLESMHEAERCRLLANMDDFFQRRIRIRFDDRPTPFSVDIQAANHQRDDEDISYLGTWVRFTGTVPENSANFGFFASRAFPPVKLVFPQASTSMGPVLLAQGERSAPISLDLTRTPALLEVLTRYLYLGFVHILPFGLDHILFVLGLFLLCGRWKPLVAMVTAFTLAHTLTLGLAAADLIRLPSQPVEILIAVSIVYIAVENIFHRKVKATHVGIVFGFGLLHGLGFAGVLGELGLPRGQFMPALFAFNLGVELGQLSVIALAFLAVGWFREKTFFRPRLAVPISLIIGGFGLFWSVERLIA